MKTHRWFLLASVALLFSSCSGSDLNPSRPSTDDTSFISLLDVDVFVEYTSAKVSGTISVATKPERITRVDVLYGNSASDLSMKASGSKDSQNGFTINLSSLEDGAKYFYRVDIIVGKSSIKGEVKSFITFPSSSVIDLDLPSGKKWASVNLGAKFPTDAGDYYAWGETSTKVRYDWDTYKYCNNGDSYKLTKYCTLDYCSANPKTMDKRVELLPEDDAATAILGESYATPTSKDWKELMDNCKAQSTTINGVKGIMLSSSKDINNYKKFIFLSSESGNYRGTEFTSGGWYWAATIDSNDPPYAFYVFVSTNMSTSSNRRSDGLTIRPIYVK